MRSHERVASEQNVPKLERSDLANVTPVSIDAGQKSNVVGGTQSSGIAECGKSKERTTEDSMAFKQVAR